jgi:TIR domain/NB-ARC domain
MTTPESDPTVPKTFISYSWDDDAHKGWVKQLASRLRTDGVDVTLDRWHAAPGDQIPAFMERAVRENDFVIAICTTRFKERSDTRSDGVGYEGDIMTAYAFTGEAEKKFIPVLRRGSWDKAAPTWLFGRAKIDLSGDPYSESEYEELLRTLHGAREVAPPIGRRPDFEAEKGSPASPVSALITPRAGSSAPRHQSSVTPLRRLFQAPPLPAHFVRRPETTRPIKMRLVSEGMGHGALAVSVIHGHPGAGKSTTASSLADDDDIINKFIDGILWVTLGLQPNLLALLTAWIKELGDMDYVPLSPDAASSYLRSLLHTRSFLLIIDDAWEVHHVMPFVVGGANCHLLITTRDALIAIALGAKLFDLGVMTQGQSLELIARRSGLESFNEDESAWATELSEVLGNLPLALELSAAQVADGIPWMVLLRELKAEIAVLEVLEQPGAEEVKDETGRKKLSVRASFHLSLRRLPPEKLSQFILLAVLPDDVVISPRMAATLWQLRDDEAFNALRYFKAKALLYQDRGSSKNERAFQNFLIHDLLRDEAARLLVSPSVPERPGDLPGLGMDLKRAHSLLIERYRSKTRNGYWHTLAEDEYIHTRLTYHLLKAEQWDEVHRLLREETEEGKNGWYAVRERLGQVTSYLTDDLAKARALADAEHPNVGPTNVGLQIRYTLVKSSFQSLAAVLPPRLLEVLVGKGVWLATQGMAYARQIQDPVQRSRALLDLLQFLNTPDREKALDDVIQLIHRAPPGRDRSEGFAALAERLAGLGRLREAVEVIRKIGTNQASVIPTIAILPRLTPELLPFALELAQVVGDSNARSELLRAIAERLVELNRPTEALAATRAIANDDVRSTTLARLSVRLADQSLCSDALDASRSIRDDKQRTRSLRALCDRFLKLERPSDALEAVGAIPLEATKAQVLISLVPHLTAGLLPQAMRIALAIGDAKLWAEALIALAPCLTIDLLNEATTSTRFVSDELERGRVLGSLAIRSAELDDSDRALALAHSITNDEIRAQTFKELTAVSNSSDRDRNLIQALTEARSIVDVRARTNSLIALAPLLPLELIREARGAAIEIADAWLRQDVFSALSQRLLEMGRIPEAANTVRAIEHPDARCKALTALAAHAEPVQADELLHQALLEALSIKETASRANTLVSITPHLTLDLLPAALAAAREIADVAYNAQINISIALRYIKLGRTVEALSVVQAVSQESAKADVLAALASGLTPDLLPEALHTVSALADEACRAKALAALAPHLTPDLCRIAIELVESIKSRKARSQVILSLATLMIDSGRGREALDKVISLEGDPKQTETLLAMALRFADLNNSSNALGAARAVPGRKSRDEVLVALSDRFGHRDMWADALATCHLISDEWRVGQQLTRLARVLPKGLLPEAMQFIQTLTDPWTRNQAQNVAATRVTELPRTDLALESARALADSKSRADALAAVIPSLPPDEQPQALRETMEALRQSSSERLTPAEALAILAPRLTPKLLAEAMKLVWIIADNRARAGVLRATAVQFARAGQLDAAMEAARSTGDERARIGALEVWARRELENGRPVEGLKLAISIGKAREWTAWLRSLSASVSTDQLAEIAAVAQRGADESVLADVLLALATQFIKSGQLAVALSAAQSIGNREIRSAALTTFSALIAQTGNVEACETTARAIRADRDRSMMLGVMAKHYAETGLSIECFRLIVDIKDDEYLDECLRQVITSFTRQQRFSDVVEAATYIKDPAKRVEAIASTFRHLASPERDKIIPAVLAAARGIAEMPQRFRALATVASALPTNQRNEVLREALSIARTIADAAERCSALALIAAALDRYEGRALAAEALETARSITDPAKRCWALAAVSPCQEPKKRQNLLREGVEGLGVTLNPQRRTDAILSIAEYIALIDHRGSKWQRVRGLISVHPDTNTKNSQLRKSKKPRSILELITASGAATTLLPQLARRLAELGSADWSLKVAGKIEEPTTRSDVVQTVARTLYERGDITGCIYAIKNIDNESTKVATLISIKPPVTPGNVTEILDAMRGIASPIHRADVLAVLTPITSPPEWTALVTDTLNQIRNVTDRGLRCKALLRLSDVYSQGERERILNEALVAAKSVGTLEGRIESLASLAPSLTPALVREVFEFAIAADDNDAYISLFSALSAKSEELSLGDARIIQERLVMSFNERLRQAVLLRLVATLPIFARSGSMKVLEEIGCAVQDVGRWWP